MSRFAGMKAQQLATPAAAVAVDQVEAGNSPSAAKARGKMIGGYFSGDLSRVIRGIAVEEGTTVQALVGEGLDAVLRARGKHPRGER